MVAVPLRAIGLHASAFHRLVIGAAFCLVAVAAVWWVERIPEHAPASAAIVASPGRSLRLAVESSYPVANWRVEVLGVAQAAASSDAWSWQGTIQAPSGEQVVVRAEAALEVSAPHRGLRLRLGDAPERLVWGAGDVVVAEPVP